MINPKHSFWLFRPFIWLWNFIAYLVTLTGRFIAVILGLVFMLVGVILTITLIGAIVGVPMFIIGLLLAIRGLW